MDDLRQDVKEIKSLTIDLIKQGAVHNELLRTHEARSLVLQAGQDKLSDRIMPLERRSHFFDIVLKAVGVIGAGVLVKILTSVLLK